MKKYFKKLYNVIKMKEMLVTVITPCYNSEKTIKRTIESVLAQSYKNIEMIGE